MKNTNPGDRAIDMKQARAAATRYKERGVSDKPVEGLEAIIEETPPDKRKDHRSY